MDELEKYLLNRFPYYDRLPPKLKVKFLHRVKNFIADKSFEGRENLEVTDEMKTWVAASAVQLTFGLDKYSLNHFSKIILYPEVYYNQRTDAMHKGETNTKGIIVLSWHDLRTGYEIPSDNFNLGLHEMAHALELELLLRRDYDNFFGDYYRKWSLIAEAEFRNIESERASFLRKYAGTNKREFFAVCIEYFFESSAEFREKLPQVYYHLSILLNQDPFNEDAHLAETIRKTDDQLLSEIGTQQPVLIPGFATWNLVVNVIYLGLIFSVLLIQGFSGFTGLFYVALVIAVVAFLSLLFRMNKIILYENYLAIKNPFGKVTDIYELDDIVAVNVSHDRPGDSLEILQARQGRIIRSNHAYVGKSSDMVVLQQKLRDKKIVVRI